VIGEQARAAVAAERAAQAQAERERAETEAEDRAAEAALAAEEASRPAPTAAEARARQEDAAWVADAEAASAHSRREDAAAHAHAAREAYRALALDPRGASAPALSRARTAAEEAGRTLAGAQEEVERAEAARQDAARALEALDIETEGQARAAAEATQAEQRQRDEETAARQKDVETFELLAAEAEDARTSGGRIPALLRTKGVQVARRLGLEPADVERLFADPGPAPRTSNAPPEGETPSVTSKTLPGMPANPEGFRPSIAPEARAAQAPVPGAASEVGVGLTRAYRAGSSAGGAPVAGKVTFASEQQRDLYDLGSRLRRMDRGKVSGAQRRETNARLLELDRQLGSRGAGYKAALAVHDDVRAQMAGLADGEARTVVDTVRGGTPAAIVADADDAGFDGTLVRRTKHGEILVDPGATPKQLHEAIAHFEKLEADRGEDADLEAVLGALSGRLREIERSLVGTMNGVTPTWSYAPEASYIRGDHVQFHEDVTGVGPREGVVTRVDENGRILDAESEDGKVRYLENGRVPPVARRWKSDDTLPSKPVGGSAPEAEAPRAPVPLLAEGRTSTAATERGTEVETRFALVDADDLIASHDTALRPDARFPEALQPRDRSRAASDEQISRIVSNLRPEFLGESPKASDGAPIVGPDGIVESGNGRTIALKRLYDSRHPGAETYRTWLVDNAAQFGLDAKAARSARAPVLVRVRSTDVDRAAFAAEANEQSTAAMSATEQAKADSARLSDGVLDLLVSGEDVNLNSAVNADFRRAFLAQVVGPNELGRYVRADGSVSAEGLTRMRNAVLAKAFGDTRAVEQLAESPDPNIKNVLGAMVAAAPRFASVRAGIARGDLHDLDLAPDVAAAAGKLSALRDSGQKVDEYIRQLGLFGSDISPEAKDLLVTFDRLKNRPKVLREALENYARAVEALGSPKQESMFGTGEPPTRAELLEAAIAEAAGEVQRGEAPLFRDTPGDGGEAAAADPATKTGGGRATRTTAEVAPAPIRSREDFERALIAAGRRPEWAAAESAIADARARAWARANGGVPEGWYTSRLAGVRGEGGEAADLRQRPQAAQRSAAQVLEQFHRSQLVSTQTVLDAIGERPEYLEPIARFITEQRQKLVAGRMTPRDVAKAYFLTAASQGSDSIRLSTLREKLAAAGVAMEVPPDFITYNKRGEAMVRPEEAAAAWLGSPSGKRALDRVQRGEFDEAAWAEGAKVRAAYGDDRLTNLNLLGEPRRGQFNLRNLDRLTHQINGAGGDSRQVGRLVKKLNGVSVGKQGFIKHLIGLGDSPTIDAVELNFWLTGQGDIARLDTAKANLAREIKGLQFDRRVINAVSDRIITRFTDLRRRGVGGDVDPAVFNHVLHHWIWDRAKGDVTTHAGMYRAMRLFERGAEGDPLGAVAFGEDNRAVITAFRGKADASTVVHELGHVFRRDLEAEDLSLVERWAGVKEGKWEEPHEEKFARSFERYLREGRAPVPELEGVFAKFKTWLTEVYRTIKGTPLDVDLSPEVRRTFDRLLGADLPPAEATPAPARFTLPAEESPARFALPSDQELTATTAAQAEPLEARIAREAEDARARLRALREANPGQLFQRSKGPKLSAAQLANVVPIAKQHLATGPDRAEFTREMVSDVGPGVIPHLIQIRHEAMKGLRDDQHAALGPQTGFEVAKGLRQSFMLSGLRGILQDTIGTSTYAVGLEEVSRAFGAVADLMVSPLTGRRALTGPSAEAVVRAGTRALRRGSEDATDILRYGASPAMIGRGDTPREIRAGVFGPAAAIVEAVINAPFCVRTIGDQYSFLYAVRRSEFEQAQAMALNEAREGTIPRDQVRVRREQILEDPQLSKALTANGIHYALEVTFKEDNRFSKGMQALRKELGPVGDFLLSIPVPFEKTLSNLLITSARHSPVGPTIETAKFAGAALDATKELVTARSIKAFRRALNASFTVDDQARFARSFGRAGTGAALMTLGAVLYKQGLLTGWYDREDQGDNARDEALGRKAGAIYDPITGTWDEIAWWVPGFSTMLIGATAVREAEQAAAREGGEAAPDTLADNPAAVARGAARAALEVPFQHPVLRAGGDLSEVRKPGGLERYAGRVAGSFIPTAVAQLAAELDLRQTNARGFWDQVKNRLPGYRQEVPTRIDALGRPVEARATAPLDPFNRTTARETTDEVARFIAELRIPLHKIEPFTKAQGRGRDETPREFEERQRLVGQAKLAVLTHYARRYGEQPDVFARFLETPDGREELVSEITADMADAAANVNEDRVPEKE
jgi:hypothetical protein